MRPLLLRPPVRPFLVTRPATGRPLCRALFSTPTTKRRPADVGLAFLSAIILSLLYGRAVEEINILAVGQRHISLLPALARARLAPEPLHLGLHIQRRNVYHFHIEQRGDGRTNLGLARV